MEVVFCFEMVIVFKSEFFNFSLAFWALFPAYFRTFVAADVYVFAREYVHHFCQDVFEETHRVFVASADYVVSNAPLFPYFIRSACATKFWICCQCC